jgi:hypothetical protein
VGVGKGLAILLITPFALVAGVLFGAGTLVYGAGDLVKGIGTVLTGGLFRWFVALIGTVHAVQSGLHSLTSAHIAVLEQTIHSPSSSTMALPPGIYSTPSRMSSTATGRCSRTQMKVK